MPRLFFLRIAVRVEAGQHAFRLPVLRKRFYVGGGCVLSACGVVLALDRAGLEEDYLRDAAADDKRDNVVLGVVRDLHRPAVDVTHVAPSGTFADFDEVAAERAARFHHSRDVVLAADELVRVREYGFAGAKHDDLVVRAYATGPIKVVFLKGLFCGYGALHFVCTPNVLHMLLVPDVVEGVVVFGRLLAEEVLAERDVVATGGELGAVEWGNDNVALLHFFQNAFVGKCHR